MWPINVLRITIEFLQLLIPHNTVLHLYLYFVSAFSFNGVLIHWYSANTLLLKLYYGSIVFWLHNINKSQCHLYFFVYSQGLALLESSYFAWLLTLLLWTCSVSTMGCDAHLIIVWDIKLRLILCLALYCSIVFYIHPYDSNCSILTIVLRQGMNLAHKTGVEGIQQLARRAD